MNRTPELKIGKFQIVRRLGRGGMGAVYEAMDTSLQRRVAIKTLLSQDFDGEEARRRFEREARAAARLQHPNIVTIHELGNFDSGHKPYIVMEYLEGFDLSDVIERDGAIPLAEALDVVAQLCGALEFAHRHDVIHRDVKPSNIRYLDDGLVKIMDFGIARMTGTAQITQSGVLMGTMRYMSPEQVRGQPLDGRTDVFSAGCILYEMLARQVAFSGEETSSVLYKIVWEEPPPILEVCPDLPEQLQDVLARALAKKTSDRFATAEEMRRELVSVLDIVQKSYPRTRRAFQKELERLESLKQKGEWRRVFSLAEKLSDERRDQVAPARLRREAVREMDRAEKARHHRPDAESRYLAEIADELKAFVTTATEPAASDTAAIDAPSAADWKSDEEARGASGKLVKLGAAALLVLGVVAAAILGRDDVPGSAGSDVPTVDIVADPPASAPAPAPPEMEEVVIVAPSAPPDAEAHEPEAIETTSVVAEEPAPERVAPEPSIPPAGAMEAETAPTANEEKQAELLTEAIVDNEEGAPSPAVEEDATPAERDATDDAPSEAATASEPAPPENVAPSSAGTLLARSTYPLSIVTADGPASGVIANPTARFTPGHHEVTLLAPEVFLKEAFEVEIQQGQTTRIYAPELGRVSIRAFPERCNLLIDGVVSEPPPIVDLAIVAGRHVFVFEWPNGSRDEKIIEVQPRRRVYVTGQRP